MSLMIIKAIKTRKFLPPKDNLDDLLSMIKFLKEYSIVAVTSKVVAISEGRCIPVDSTTKDQIAISEAEWYIPREISPNGQILNTIKNNLLVASSGVDESNGNDYYILWPKKPKDSAKKIWNYLKNKFKIENLGVIITDSRLIPLRRGVVGLAISYFGFKPIKDYRGKKDIFGRKFVMETSNFPDSLASAAVLEMGEGAEQQPIAVINQIPNVEFINREYKPKLDDNFEIPLEEDMFSPFLTSVKWKKGGSGKNQ